MENIQKKLPGEAVNGMIQLQMDLIQPYSLMWTPAYVFFKANDKLLLIKRPLDFFTEHELRAISPYQVLYFSRYFSEIIPIQEKGKKLRKALLLGSGLQKSATLLMSDEDSLSPTSFELSDYALRSAASLWLKGEGDGLSIEPFLVAVFVNQVCDALPSEKLLKAREASIFRFSNAILKSSWVVFLALHLGYCHLSFLNRLLNQIFDDCMQEVAFESCKNELDELVQFTFAHPNFETFSFIKSDVFMNRAEKVAQKIDQRLKRVSQELLKSESKPPSIYGVKGFLNA